jgi:predicted glycosyltransferase
MRPANSEKRSSRRRILIDVCHPAEVHHFKHLYWQLSQQGWTFLFVAKHKDVTADLLRALKLPFILFSSSKPNVLKKVFCIPYDVIRFYAIVRRFRPAFLFSNLSIHASWVAAVYPLVHIAFVDTEHRRLLDFLTLPFAHLKFTPQSYQRRLGRFHFRYAGNHELAYLHPKRFKPNADILNVLGLEADEKYVLLRFVAWQAFHDVGLHGIPITLKKRLIAELEKNRRVFISSESTLPEELKTYQLNVPPDRIHDVLYYADAYIGEGGTMASEAACLGTPAVYINALPLGYCLEEAEAGLLFYFDQMQSDDIPHIVAIRKDRSFLQKKQDFIDQCEDVTGFMAQFLTRYPASLRCWGRDPSQ